jgi:hypothetical protein
MAHNAGIGVKNLEEYVQSTYAYMRIMLKAHLNLTEAKQKFSCRICNLCYAVNIVDLFGFENYFPIWPQFWSKFPAISNFVNFYFFAAAWMLRATSNQELFCPARSFLPSLASQGFFLSR